MRLQRSLLSQQPARDRGRRADRPLQRRRRRPRDRRRLVRRGAPLRRHRARDGRRRRGPRRHGGRAHGPAAQRLPRARLRAHLARGAAAADAAPRRRGRDGDRALPHARPVHAGAHLRLRRAIRRRCSSTATPPRSSRLGHALAPPLGYVQASAIREATVELPAGAHARGLHRRPRRAPRLEHRHRHRPARLGRRILAVARGRAAGRPDLRGGRAAHRLAPTTSRC